MDGKPTTIEYQGTAPPRFGAGCAACGARDPTTNVAFAGAKEKVSHRVTFGVTHAAFAASASMLATASQFVRTAVAIGVGAVYVGIMGLVELRRRRAAAFEVPLCDRCAADVLAIRAATREMIATFVICLAVAIGVDLAFRPAPWIPGVLTGCGIVAALAALRRIGQATKETDRFAVERRVGALRFKFADAEAARRFRAENLGKVVGLGRG